MKSYFALIVIIFFMSCSTPKKSIDLLIINGTVYTCDKDFSTAKAVAIDSGKIVETGSIADLQEKYKAKEVINAHRKFIYPGFMDAHAHFVSYGLSLQEADLVGTQSWEDVLKRLQDFAAKNPSDWIVGNGWDQNDWEDKSFPDNTELNKLFPDRPVILSRIDGHAAIANATALALAGIQAGDTLTGGNIEVHNDTLTGILLDNATGLVFSKLPPVGHDRMVKALLQAQDNCFAVGLTSIVDCGLPYQTALLIDSLQKRNELKMRLYVLLSDAKENYDFLFNNGPIKTDRLSVRAFKLFADGALGSRGACLLEPYSDQPGWNGFLLSSKSHYDSAARIIYEHGYQMCTHAIGDSANRMILKTYAKYLKGKNDLRWRVEHAQVINKDDFHYFGDNNIIPSVQPTHATSDMYWAGDRLGKERLRYSYANKELLEQNGWIALGTDFPVEDISPIKTFYAAVFRKDASGYPPEGFQMGNALSRKEALLGMTIWAAKSTFEENEKGSLEPGKKADLVLLNQDLMKAGEGDILQTRILMTLVGGEKVFEVSNYPSF